MASKPTRPTRPTRPPRLPKTYTWRGVVLERWTQEWTGKCPFGQVFVRKVPSGRYRAWVGDPEGSCIQEGMEEALEFALRLRIQHLCEKVALEKAWLDEAAAWIGETNGKA